MKRIETILQNPYDCLILSNPQIQVLNKARELILSFGIPEINVNERLSTQLISIPMKERGKAAEDWLMNVSVKNPDETLLIADTDLIFYPSLGIDTFELIRKLSHLQRLIILWPGNYQANLLSYAIPEHKHYRFWKTPASLLNNPKVLIHQLDSEEGL